MAKKYYTVTEIQELKFYELPDVIYNAIFRELENLFHVITSRLREILDKATVMELDQYVDIYKYICIV